MEHHRDDINDINPIIITHEFMHLIVDKVLSKGHYNVPTFINEGMAHNVAWMLYDERSDWTSTFTDREWDGLSQSNDPVPDLWPHEAQDAWTTISVSFLVNKYGVPKLIKYLERINEDADAFTNAFGITPKQFQSEYEEEVWKIRGLNGIEKPIVEVVNEAPPRQFSKNDVGIKIDGKYIEVDPKAKVIGGSTYIPLRGVFEAMGATIKWSPAPSMTMDSSGKRSKPDYTGIVTIRKGATMIELFVGTNRAYVNDILITLTAKPFIENGSTFVPLRFASEGLGAEVKWEPANYTAVIESLDQ